MPWKVSDVMNERNRFVLRALDPNRCMSSLCREFGISRRTGYKWVARYKENGETGLDDLSRRPRSSPLRTSSQLITEIVRLRTAHPSWGPKKLRELLLRRRGSDPVPAQSTIAKILAECGLVQPRRRRRSRADQQTNPRVCPQRPNDLWTVDFKGWWRTRDGQRCEPLTIRDDWSRYLLEIRLLQKNDTNSVRDVFEDTFSRYGLPAAIRTDNGPPFASLNSPSRLTRLSAWWTALGVQIDNIDPGSPQQNGGHERMHRDLAAEIQPNVARDMTAQQRVLEDWRVQFNTERPHESLQMKTPAQLYSLSPAPYTGKRPEICYPGSYDVRVANNRGCIRFHRKHRFVSEAVASWPLGLQLHGDQLRVWFTDICLGATKPDFSEPLSPLRDC